MSWSVRSFKFSKDIFFDFPDFSPRSPWSAVYPGNWSPGELEITGKYSLLVKIQPIIFMTLTNVESPREVLPKAWKRSVRGAERVENVRIDLIFGAGNVFTMGQLMSRAGLVPELVIVVLGRDLNVV